MVEDEEGDRRRMAVCTSCESAYAARIASDGTVQPIGSRDGCECGSTSFEVVEAEDAPDAVHDDETPDTLQDDS